jgi:hypothetical protein
MKDAYDQVKQRRYLKNVEPHFRISECQENSLQRNPLVCVLQKLNCVFHGRSADKISNAENGGYFKVKG